MRWGLVAIAGLVALAAVVTLGLSQTHSSNTRPVNAAPSPEAVRAAFAGASAPLGDLHSQAGQLLAGTPAAVKRRLGALRGYPVVVNKWASWCGPCRAEFPFLQRSSVALARTVAFVGLNAGDNTGDARSFLARFPLTYPSYEDPSENIARSLGLGGYYPETLFVDRRGAVAYVHQGGYATQAKLEQDIHRYALRS